MPVSCRRAISTYVARRPSKRYRTVESAKENLVLHPRLPAFEPGGDEQLPILLVAIQPLQVKERKVTRARIVDTPSSWLRRSVISPIIASFRSRTCRW